MDGRMRPTAQALGNPALFASPSDAAFFVIDTTQIPLEAIRAQVDQPFPELKITFLSGAKIPQEFPLLRS